MYGRQSGNFSRILLKLGKQPFTDLGYRLIDPGLAFQKITVIIRSSRIMGKSAAFPACAAKCLYTVYKGLLSWNNLADKDLPMHLV